MLQEENVATPADAFTVLFVQARAPKFGLVPMASVTAPLSVVTVLPAES